MSLRAISRATGLRKSLVAELKKLVQRSDSESIKCEETDLKLSKLERETIPTEDEEK